MAMALMIVLKGSRKFRNFEVTKSTKTLRCFFVGKNDTSENLKMEIFLRCFFTRKSLMMLG